MIYQNSLMVKIEPVNINTTPDYISCSFKAVSEEPVIQDNGVVDVYFARTIDLSSRYTDLRNYLSHDELLRADRFHHDKIRETYIACHAMLRLVLAQSLDVKPLDIEYQSGINGKPGLIANPLYFNITHTRDAFALAIYKDNIVGIDLERINQNIAIHSIIESYFSKDEREYILESSAGMETKDRFFLLWTRKEALLKALGVGIIDKLSQIEVSGRKNFINKDLFDNYAFDSTLRTLYLSSIKLPDSYLSIAIPAKAQINYSQLNYENIYSYFK